MSNKITTNTHLLVSKNGKNYPNCGVNYTQLLISSNNLAGTSI